MQGINSFLLLVLTCLNRMKPPGRKKKTMPPDENKLFLQRLRDENEAFKKLIRQLKADDPPGPEHADRQGPEEDKGDNSATVYSKMHNINSLIEPNSTTSNKQ